jgi:hypothetical protein
VSGSEDFEAGIDRFLATMPHRSVKGTVEVDQVYAHYQHEHPEFHHPSGGEAFFLTTPLFAKFGSFMERLAQRAITSAGSDLVDAMMDNMEALSLEVYQRAPWEFADLRASGHPYVEVDGTIEKDRAPMCHRLSADELRIKSELRQLLWPDRYR